MRIVFQLDGSTYKTSPDFACSPQQETAFFDALGGEEEESELFWDADIEGTVGEEIRVLWFKLPTSPDTIIQNLSKLLGVGVPPYITWK
jgi:hypothetical protein